MNDHNYSETRVIGFPRLCAFLLLGPVVLPVFMLFGLVYWLDRAGWRQGWRWWVLLPLVVSFSVINFIHNATVCTILFMEWPREFQTTTRLKRMKSSPDPAKRELADLMGGFLDSQHPDHY
jgi:cytochrome c oxidase assembly factor CtaG